jgi:hypothetical protein
MNKRILIVDYPTTMTFEVRKELPEFNDYCEVRQKILLYQLRKQKIESPCHSYTDYVVEDIFPLNDGEVWIIGS